MLDHIGVSVSDLDSAKSFYSASLAPLGISLLMDITAAQSGTAAFAGFGRADKAFFWIGNNGVRTSGVHVAFTAASRAEVDAFYEAALRAGGTDNGAPGLRPHYHPNYYGAFVRDQDGNNIEAVCHAKALPAAA
jgi:catechol 2,3-dioxygenase-like lactoylglutathione lyase family enzyme